MTNKTDTANLVDLLTAAVERAEVELHDALDESEKAVEAYNAAGEAAAAADTRAALARDRRDVLAESLAKLAPETGELRTWLAANKSKEKA